MKKLIIVLCLLSFMGINASKAQKVWSLEECINYAYQNNLQVKRQELNVQYNKNNYSQSKFNTLPNLNGYFDHSYNSGKSLSYGSVLQGNIWRGDLGLQSSVTVFNGFQTVNDIKQKRYLFLQSQADLDKSKNDMALQLTVSYLQILFDKELLDVAKSKLDVTTQQAERTKKLVDVGNLAQGEYYGIKAQAASDKLAVVNAQNNLGISYLNLAQLLDLDSTGGFDIVIPANLDVQLVTPLESVDNIYAKALESLPQIKRAEYGLKSSEKQLSKTWGLISPSVAINGGLTSQYYQIKDASGNVISDSYSKQISDNYLKEVTLSISIPIFNRLQSKNAISNAKIGVMDSRYALDQAKLALYKDIQQAHADALAAMEKYNASVEAVTSNEESFKYTQQKFEVGLVNSVDFNIAKSNLVEAQSNMLQAKYDYIFKLKIIDFYMGKPIVL